MKNQHWIRITGLRFQCMPINKEKVASQKIKSSNGLEMLLLKKTTFGIRNLKRYQNYLMTSMQFSSSMIKMSIRIVFLYRITTQDSVILYLISKTSTAQKTGMRMLKLPKMKVRNRIGNGKMKKKMKIDF